MLEVNESDNMQLDNTEEKKRSRKSKGNFRNQKMLLNECLDGSHQ